MTSRSASSVGRTAALVAAVLGWLFDGFEMGLFSLIGGPATEALVAERLGRRPTYALLCLATVAAAVWLYQGHDAFGWSFLAAAFVAGGTSASFYGLFPLSFPELFPTAVRATGQGFALNFGRIIAAIGGLQTAALMGYFGGSFPQAGSVLVAIYLVGAVIVWLGPETKAARCRSDEKPECRPAAI